MQHYINELSKKYQTGGATEHSFRGDLQNLLQGILDQDYLVINEPKRRQCGAPDYIIEKKGIPVGFIEAKDIGDKDLLGEKKTGNKEQFDRYKSALNNIIFTDYLRFYFYRNGELVEQVTIGEVKQNYIVALPEQFTKLKNLLKDFVLQVGQNIKSPKKLAEMMANKARLLANIIEQSLNNDDEQEQDSSLYDQMQGFKQILIHDISNKGFADVYAQTITYGMFAARLHDQSLNTFSRQEAMELIPKTNPFLRNLFSYISGVNLDDRIQWIVDSLAEIFLHCDVREVLKNYGRSTKTNEPIIHFYETFLSEYDPSLRKARGVWYTPAPVVNFIVRAVDEILKQDFGLIDGLADDSKTTIEIKATGTAVTKGKAKGKKLTEHKQVHKVQILDPATGTGTFLSAVVQHIYQQYYQGQQGIWSSYVEESLIPRLNGFELLMASYAMAHLQLDLLLAETGYQTQKAKRNQRFKIYLTNSLEESHADTGTLFTSWLSNEANEANFIKRDTPVMVVMGNPPYSISSNNKSQWILDLLEDYKKDLNEKNIQPLSDDYIKFIRYGQHYIDKNQNGILAYISNNSFIDGLTHRQMRKVLLESFDKIYIIDLHGNTKKKETAPDGSKDENVFDIMQGVSINLFVKTGKKAKGELAQVYHYDLYGKRDGKYQFLNEHRLSQINFTNLTYQQPNYFFVPKDFSLQNDYEKGFLTSELLTVNTSGIKTHDDNNLVSFSTFEYFNEEYSYRPFDNRFICYDLKKVQRHRYNVMKHMLHDNFALLLCRQAITEKFGYFVTDKLCDINFTGTAGQFGAGLAFPLYLYSENIGENGEKSIEKNANFNEKIIAKFAKGLKMTLVMEKSSDIKQAEKQFSPVDVLDYIYAVLYSPTYRERYKEFLKIDFPRIPYPTDNQKFWQLVKLGAELRQLHLMQSPKIKQWLTQYPQTGDNVVGKISYQQGKVYINDTQYFDNVPEIAWNFYIGGYQPAQKWLKDRKERALNHHDIRHYQSIIVVLMETDRLMKEIKQII